MAMYFLSLVFLTAIIIFFQDVFVIRILHLFQMLFLSIVIAMTQVVFVDQYLTLSKSFLCPRSVVWLLFSGLMTYLTSKAFLWFPQAPTWSPPILASFMILVLTLMLLGNRWEQEADTLRLNRNLEHFKTKGGS
jgi:hypothetical protein